MPATRIPWGSCYCAAATESSEDNLLNDIIDDQHSRSTPCAVTVNGSAILIHRLDANGNKSDTFLCRFPLGLTQLVCQKDSILHFDTQIRVHGIKSAPVCVEKASPFGDLQAPQHEDQSTVHRASSFFSSTNDVSNSYQNIPIMGYVESLDDVIPTTISSLRLQLQPDDEDGASILDQPLLLACWKRQLVGAVLLWNPVEKVSCTMCVAREEGGDRSWEVTVESLTTQSKSDTSTLYTITPNTRTTVISSKANISGADTANSTHTADGKSEKLVLSELPPFAALLAETMDMCRQAVSAPTLVGNDSGHAPLALPPRSFLCSGPPGTGKTYAVRRAVEWIKQRYQNDDCANLVSFSGSSLLGNASHFGEAASALHKAFQKAASVSTNEGKDPIISLLFLDEAEALVASPIIAVALGVLLDRMNTDDTWSHVVVVAATNRIDSIPQYLRRPGRFDRELLMVPPNAKERASILSQLLSDHSIALTEDQLLEFSSGCVGYVPADMAALVRRALLYFPAMDDQKESPTPSQVIDGLYRAQKEVGASVLRDAALKAPPSTTWDHIAGDPGGAKTALRQAIEWPRKHKKAFEALGLIPPRGILLFGPPGCAKTSLARAAAGASGVAFLSLSPAEVYASSYVGEAEAVIRQAFTLARSASPCILFFDEIDSIIGAEHGNSGDHGMARGSSAEARVLSTFLNEMDGIDSAGASLTDGVLVLGATNRPWTLDAAILRPGRFDKVIHVPPPDEAGRLSILQAETKAWPTGDEGIDLKKIASDGVTGSFTGAELIGACREAAQYALREGLATPEADVAGISVREEFLLDAIKRTKPLLKDPNVAKEFTNYDLAHRDKTK